MSREQAYGRAGLGQTQQAGRHRLALLGQAADEGVPAGRPASLPLPHNSPSLTFLPHAYRMLARRSTNSVAAAWSCGMSWLRIRASSPASTLQQNRNRCCDAAQVCTSSTSSSTPSPGCRRPRSLLRGGGDSSSARSPLRLGRLAQLSVQLRQRDDGVDVPRVVGPQLLRHRLIDLQEGAGGGGSRGQGGWDGWSGPSCCVTRSAGESTGGEQGPKRRLGQEAGGRRQVAGLVLCNCWIASAAGHGAEVPQQQRQLSRVSSR